MKRKRFFALITIIGFLLFIAAILIACNFFSLLENTYISGNASSKSVPLLHTSGSELYYTNNDTARLYLAVIQDGQGFHVSQSDIQHIANMGFKGVRFFIYWGQCQPAANTISTTYFSSGIDEPGDNAIDDIVNWCSNAGLYIMLCPGWSSTYEIPVWAQSVTGLTSGDSPRHTDMLNNETIQSGISHLYSFIAERYASYSNVIFESFNELTIESPCNASDRVQFSQFNNVWVSAVEANEGSINHIKVIQLLYDWSTWNYVLSTSTPATISGTHENIILATHDYPLIRESPIFASVCANIWANFVHGQNYPWMDTEYSHALGGDFTGLLQGTDLIDKNGAVGWGYFDYETSENSVNTANVNNPANAALILPILRPYMDAYKW